MIKGIIFDLDGTLVNSLPDLKELMNTFLRTINLPSADDELVKRCIGGGAYKSMERLLEHFNALPSDETKKAELFDTYMKIYNSDKQTRANLFSGVKETLQSLKEQGKKLAICTNKPFKPAVTVLKNFKIYDYFTEIITADSSPFMKPDPRVIELIRDKLNLPLSELLMVGDAEPDILCAQKAKIISVFAAYGYFVHNPADLNADFTIKSMHQLLKIITNLDI